MIDQNTIILVLILIVILVAFYSAYLSMDNSRKIKKLQSELKNTLTILNETLNLKDQLHPNLMEDSVCEKPKNKCMPKEDLSRYPSLDELGNFEPLDNNTKEEIDNLVSIEHDNSENVNEVEQEVNIQDDNIEEDNIEEDNIEEDNIEEIETNERQNDQELGEMSIDELSKNRNLPEDNDNTGIQKDLNVDELIMEEIADAVNSEVVEVEQDLEEDGNLEGALEGELEGEGEGDVEENKDDNIDVVEDSKDESYPELDKLDKDILSSYSLKNIKEICKREDLRLSGSKNQLIERVLKKKEFKVEI